MPKKLTKKQRAALKGWADRWRNKPMGPATIAVAITDLMAMPDTPDTGPILIPNPPEHWSENPALWATIIGIIIMLIDVL